MFIRALTICAVLFCAATLFGDEPKKAPPKPENAAEDAPKQEEKPAPSQEELFKQFTETMNNIKMVGRFTIAGKEDGDLKKEEYEISSVKKLPRGDLWLINARIKYGEHDLSLPLPLDVKWAGDTPVITLTDLTIPGLGTFSARVVIHEGKYAGTWRHGEVGGHLFGDIKKKEKE